MKKNLIRICLMIAAALILFIFPMSCSLRKTNNENIIKNQESQKVPQNQVKINFKDSELEKMIRCLINKEEGNIYPEDLTQIKEIYVFGKTINKIVRERDFEVDADGYGAHYEYEDVKGNKYTEMGEIKNIDDLAYFPNLEKITLVNQKIDSVKALENLKKIKYLCFRNNKIREIDSLKSLSDLEYVDFTYNDIVNFSTLSDLKKIKYLDMSNNAMLTQNELAFLKRLDKLETLVIRSAGIEDFTPIKEMKNLRNLDISYNNPSECFNETTDLSALKELISLEILTMDGNSEVDLAAIGELENLYELSAYGCYIDNIDCLKNLTKLKSLCLFNNAITDITVVRNFLELEYLDLDSNMISDISPIKYLKKLKKLNILSNPIDDYSVIENMKNVEIEGYK